jgi:hypothetical protein
MFSDTKTPDKFTLQCERREDGGLRIWSDDVPGLILSGLKPRDVMRDVIPAIDALTRHNGPRLGKIGN